MALNVFLNVFGCPDYAFDYVLWKILLFDKTKKPPYQRFHIE